MTHDLLEFFDGQYDVAHGAFLLEKLEDINLLPSGDKFKLQIAIMVQNMLREKNHNEPFESWTLAQTIYTLSGVKLDNLQAVPKRKINKVLRELEVAAIKNLGG